MIFKIRKINFKEKKTQKIKKILKKRLKQVSEKTKKISLKTAELTKQHNKKIAHVTLIVVPLLILGGIIFTIISSAMSILNIAPALPCFVCSELKTDSHNRTNILLSGMGGEEHSGGTLTDTIILVSLDHTQKNVTMLSIPRDLWVQTQTGKNRINNIYEYGKEYQTPELGMEFLAKTVGEITGIYIHYYALIDFPGIVDIIDAVDGIDIDIPENIYDPYYPKDRTYDYETFYIKAGQRHLDGKTALKYARSRKTSSDYARSKRQHDILSAIKEQAITTNILTNPKKIKKILDAIDEHFLTNITFKEMLALADIASEFDSNKVYSHVYSDQWEESGGFFYTPERQYFNGAFVLLPNSLDYSETQTFAYLFVNYPEIFRDQTPIQLLNGTKHTGIAKKAADLFTRYGFNIISYNNASQRTMKSTQVYQIPSERNFITLKALGEFIPVQNIMEINSGNLDKNFEPKAAIFIMLGEDFYTFYQTHKKWFY